jgi:hypothetical protein
MGGISNKTHDHFRFFYSFLLFFFFGIDQYLSDAVFSKKLCRILRTTVPLLEDKVRNFEIVCCSYFVHQIKRYFTIHILPQVPLTQHRDTTVCRSFHVVYMYL